MKEDAMELQLDEFEAGPDDGGIDLADFHGLLAPVSAERFQAEYWQNKPLLIRGRLRRSIQRVLSLPLIDALLGQAVLRPTDLRASKDHHPAERDRLFPEGVADKQAVFDLFGEGYSLIFDQIDRHLPALGAVMYAWETALKQPVRANAFLTPRSSRGFNRHFDTHDVVVVQVHGSKVWDVCDSPLPLPHEDQQHLSSHHGARAALIRQVELQPGDVLYLPRGFVHGAQANAGDTLHLSVSIRNRALREVLAAGLREQVLRTPALKAGLRFDTDAAPRIKRELLAAVERIDVGAALADLGAAFLGQRQRVDNRLSEFEAARALRPESRLRFAPQAWLETVEDAEGISVIANGERIRFAGGDERLLAALRSRTPFLAGEFPCAAGQEPLAAARDLYLSGVLRADDTDVRV
ncbi:cupin domain-containing protein [Pseudomonas sp. CGJS7]|uniref:cupin domain-containing protein n=1 Tax=Pseudomonas sp. CGJS7 TaxID=3109348 RepID=UPI003009E521